MLTRIRTFLSRTIVVAATCAAAQACTTQETLGAVGGVCDTDDQCQIGLSCKCVVILSTDDEGNDYIAQHGTCEKPTYVCPKDGGTDAVVVPSDARVDTGSDTGGGTTDATLGGDASDATSSDADAAVDAGANDTATASEASPDAVGGDAHD
jgi:hypothetical protein